MIETPDQQQPVALRGGEVHSQTLDLEAGDFFHAIAEQHGIDLIVRLRDPHGQEVHWVDSPTGNWGPEELLAIAAEPGRYRLEVAAPTKDVDPGHYLFRVAARRPATAADRELVAADHAYHAGRRRLKERAYQEAADLFHHALTTWRRLGDRRREAETLHELGRAQEAEELRLGLARHSDALAIYRELDDRGRMARMLHRIGLLRLRLGETESALRSFAESLELFRHEGDDAGVAAVLARLGTTYDGLGRLQQALDHFEQSLDASRTIGDLSMEGFALIDMVPLLLALHRSEEARHHSLRAVEIYEQLDRPENLAQALNRLASAQIQLGEVGKALEHLERAIGIQRQRGLSRDLAVTLNTYGNALVLPVQPPPAALDRARAAFDEAMALAEQMDEPHLKAILLTNAGDVDRKAGDPQRGLELFQQAFKIFESLDDLKGQASSRLGMGETLRDLGRLDEALVRIQAAVEQIETLRTLPERRELRTTYFAFRQGYFETAVDILMRLHDRDPAAGYDVRAFDLNERRLARELIDTLALSPREWREAADPSLLERESALVRELNTLAPPSGGASLEQLEALLAKLDKVRGEISRGVARFSEPLTAAEIRQTVLDDESLLLVYALGEPRSTLWALSCEKLTSHPLPPRGQLEALAEALAHELPRAPSLAAGVAAGARLGEVLLRPVVERLGNRRLIVVSEGALQSISFTALPDPHAGSPDRPLILAHEIVTLPSISVVASLRRALTARQAARQTVAVFADPVFENADPRVGGGPQPAAGPPAAASATWQRALQRATEDLGLERLRRLPGSRTEAEAILALLRDSENGFLATDFAASRRTLASHDWRGYRILHFATHTLLNRRHPELSGLVLSLVDETGRPQDGFVPCFEIAGLDLPVELVVLSACETGQGKDIRGEGLQGLSRSFLRAGAARVIASLWKVGDERTAELMIDFYRAHLQDGLPPAAALRQAQIAMLRDPSKAEPYSWAGFVFQGEWRESRGNRD